MVRDLLKSMLRVWVLVRQRLNLRPLCWAVTGRLNINTYTYKSKNLKNRKLKRKRKQKRKRGSLREGREAPPRRCPHPFRFCFRFRFNFRLFNFLFLYVYVLIFNRPVTGTIILLYMIGWAGLVGLVAMILIEFQRRL